MAAKVEAKPLDSLAESLNSKLKECGISAYASPIGGTERSLLPFDTSADRNFLNAIIAEGEVEPPISLGRVSFTPRKEWVDRLRLLLQEEGIFDYSLIELRNHIPKEGEFEQDISDLTEAERELVHAFAKALIAERPHLHLDFPSLSYSISDLSYSGRLSEWFSRASELAKAPPARMPRAWDPDSGEPPAIAVLNIFGYWMDQGRMHQGVLHSLCENLYAAYHSRKRYQRSMKDEELAAQRMVEAKLPTKKVFNDKRLGEELPEQPLDRHELLRLKRARAHREKVKQKINDPSLLSR